MKKKRDNDDIGTFNVLLIGDNPRAVSIADNIKARFSDVIQFNIVDDIDVDGTRPECWFHEFTFALATGCGKYSNIVVSRGFWRWLNSSSSTRMERMYMKKLLQAMNFVILDVSEEDSTGEETHDAFGGDGAYDVVLDNDIPQLRFNDAKDFMEDAMKWIGRHVDEVAPHVPKIRLVRTLSGGSLPYIGDVFGCLSGKKYSSIVHADKMRFDAPILFDEFCHLTRRMDYYEIDSTIMVRSSSALKAFFT